MDKTKKCSLDGNIPLYIGATALLISVITVIFFYREIRKIKKDVCEIKQVKNQISNVDSRFDIIENSIDELTKLIKQPRVTFKETLRMPEESKKDSDKESEESDDDVEVESVDEE